MRAGFLAITLYVVLAVACSDDDHEGSYWGVDHAGADAIVHAEGTIDQQNAGPKVTYTVESAYLTTLENGTHLLHYRFTSQDSLELLIGKRSADYNYHSDATSDQNVLLSVAFNNSAMALEGSAVSIQPRSDENRFHTVVNVHTLDKGDFNGTINGVPLVDWNDVP